MEKQRIRRVRLEKVESVGREFVPNGCAIRSF
jgi:hypothetical protein